MRRDDTQGCEMLNLFYQTVKKELELHVMEHVFVVGNDFAFFGKLLDFYFISGG